MLRKAFTLMEVNLAIMIMAGGILSLVALYGLGYRENRQSREDVASSAYADAVISPLVAALSATNLKWSVFRKLPSYPSLYGWRDYVNQATGIAKSDCEAKAKNVYESVMDKVKAAAEGSLSINATWPSGASGGMKAGLLVLHDEDSAVVRIAFRATPRPQELLAMPLYYTEVRFQGIYDKAEDQ